MKICREMTENKFPRYIEELPQKQCHPSANNLTKYIIIVFDVTDNRGSTAPRISTSSMRIEAIQFVFFARVFHGTRSWSTSRDRKPDTSQQNQLVVRETTTQQRRTRCYPLADRIANGPRIAKPTSGMCRPGGDVGALYRSASLH